MLNERVELNGETVLKTVLVAGVSSGVGPSLVLNGLKTYWQRYREREPISTLTLPVLTPTMLETGEEPNLAELWRSLGQARQDADLVCVGSDGNLASPVTQDTTLATLAKEWRLPVVLVVPVEWGAIAQTVATVALAREAKVTLAGVILSHQHPTPDISVETMTSVLQSLTHVSILGSIPFVEDPSDANTLAHITSPLMLDVLIDKLDASGEL